MGPFFKIVKNMGLCNMGSFLKTRKYGSKQYGFISENWTHIGQSKYGLKTTYAPEGHCGCLVNFLSTTPNMMIFKITPGTCVLKTNFYTHKKKSHVPALILKFLTTTPNLTSNFET